MTARWSAFSCCMAHWPDVGGTLGGIDDGYLFRRAADPDREDIRRPASQSGAGRHHQDQRARCRIARWAISAPSHSGENRRAAVPRIDRQYGRASSRGIAASWTSGRRRRARARSPCPTASTKRNRSWTTTASARRRVPIRVRVDVKGDRMTVDLTEVPKQVGGFYNSGETDRPRMRPGRLQVPDLAARSADQRRPVPRARYHIAAGPRVSAVKPAAMRMWMTFPMTIVDTIFKALAPALPEQVIAGHHADLVVAASTAASRKTGVLYLYRRPDRRRLGRQV